jgi:WD repeat-containing protein 55
VQLLPTKLIGVIADHGSFPIERIAVDRGGEGRWVGSAGHEEVLKLTDLKDVFEDEDENEDKVVEVEADNGEDGYGGNNDGDEVNQQLEDLSKPVELDAGADASGDEEHDSDFPKERKRKRKQDKDVLAGGKKKGRNQVDAEPSFFSGL